MKDLSRAGPFTMTDAQRQLLTNIQSDLWRMHDRMSAFQLEHFAAKHREYPGDADKFHKYGIEIFARYDAVSVLLHTYQVASCDLEDAEASRARWRWLAWTAAGARAVRRLDAERSWLNRRLGAAAHELSEYFRELGTLWTLREHYRKKCEEADVALDFDADESKRWVDAALNRANEDLRDRLTSTVRTDFPDFLRSLGAGGSVVARDAVDAEVRRHLAAT